MPAPLKTLETMQDQTNDTGGIWTVLWQRNQKHGFYHMQESVKADSEEQARKHLDFNMKDANRMLKLNSSTLRFTGYEITKIEAFNPEDKKLWVIEFCNGLDVVKYEPIEFPRLEKEANDYAAGRFARANRARYRYSHFKVVEKAEQ